MIPSAFLHTLSFPWMLLSPTGELIDAKDGALFKLPLAANNTESIEYCKQAPVGWSKCPKGFAVYCRVLPVVRGGRLVLHGLKVTGVSTAAGKSEHLSIKTSSSEIERYLNHMILVFSEQIEAYVSNIMRRSVHEARDINKDIKAATEDIIFALMQKEIDVYDVRERVKNIQALSEIFSVRTDFLDYFANPEIFLYPDQAIRVHNKFFKTIRSLQSRAMKKNVNLRSVGSSDGQISGLRVFDVIPFILLQNAIKYSPDGQLIDVIFSENPSEIEITVRNVGPAVEASEAVHIFQMGGRGKNAILTGVNGTGIGLFFVRELVEIHHHGKITFTQKDMPRMFKGVEYRTTEITLKFPRVR